MDLTLRNEQDVREDVATPFLQRLGYQAGTANDIERELHLTYKNQFLGHKKEKDPPLRGKADYRLNVLGVGSWVLETKSPTEEITPYEIEQALTYARHPEVSGIYVAILNGRDFVLLRSSQRASEKPLLALKFESVEQLCNLTRALLSPAAIRRDHSPPLVDLGRQLAEGLRSSAVIKSGWHRYHQISWECAVPLAPKEAGQMEEVTRRLRTLTVPIVGGRVWRDQMSRIRVKPQ